MRKTFLVLCIVALALLGLSTLPRMTATGDSDFAIGNLSKIAEELGVVPEEDGKYSLASILEALYASVESTNKRVSDLGTTTGYFISSLRSEMRSIKQEPLNNMNIESRFMNTESRLRQLENEVRPGGGSYLESRIQWLESSMRQTERELNDLWNQLNNCCR